VVCDLSQFDTIDQMITLSEITLIGFHFYFQPKKCCRREVQNYEDWKELKSTLFTKSEMFISFYKNWLKYFLGSEHMRIVGMVSYFWQYRKNILTKYK